MRRFAAVAGILLALPAAAAPSLEVTLDPPAATVGELVAATLTVRGTPADSTQPPRFPDWSHGWGEVEVREASTPEQVAAPAGALWRQRLVLAAYRTGELRLPPVAVLFPGEPPTGVATPAELALEIRSVLPEDPTAWEPEPPSAPVALEVPRAFWWTTTALAVMVIAATWLGLLRWRRRAASGTAPALSPWEELTLALAAIEVADLTAADRVISLALRRFLGRAFAMPAAQSSTSELARRLGRRGLPPELVRRTIRLLRETDQVKFARVAATGERVTARRDEALEIGRAVEHHLRPPAETERAA